MDYKQESYLESQLLNRGVTLKEHEIKMANLTRLMKEGYKVMRAVEHDKYVIEGLNHKGIYNPYTDSFQENK